MRAKILSLLLMVTASSCVRPSAVAAPRLAPVVIATADMVVLPDSVAQLTLRQCSRETPRVEPQFWTPDSRTLAGLDSLLARRLERALDARGDGQWRADSVWHQEPLSYAIQVIGVVSEGRRLVYVNGVLSMFARRTPRAQWSSYPMGACDGGTAFFGALYDPERRELRSFQFNASM